ncbi:plasmid replication protein RepC (plasmid) [Rhizobium sp. CB3171]|uniref:plasmid replication protein RepC n=1 Tax=Rhizobium sp. CB3171 TaxID=3039157 RepID=UPI0024B09580|nr:plasmid replication protein RepC [Rhizobium sp. CB3171]WFU07200.1 plasmid replication protein RepC [Rhizobium sp. CB3171]
MDQDTHPRPYGRRTPVAYTYMWREEAHQALTGRVERKTLLTAAGHAGRALRLPCSARTLLSTLAACYGEQQLSQGLLVWPSNNYLMDKTGLPERTLRSAIALLRQQGLIIAVDSPNGKRFARRQGNSVTIAYGFDLGPLFAKRERFAAAVAEDDAERALVRSLRHDLSAIHKDLQDLVAALNELGRIDLASGFDDAIAASRPPRNVHVRSDELAEALRAAELSKTIAERAYYEASKPKNSAATDGNFGRHKESNTDCSIENCHNRSGAESPQHLNNGAASGGTFAAFEERCGRAVRLNEQSAVPAKVEEEEEWREAASLRRGAPPTALLDVALWKSACPALEDYAQIRSIEDVVGAGALMARLLQVAPHGLERAKRQLGPRLFSFVAAFVYQLYADDQARPRPEIRKPGGFFCYVAKEVAEGTRDLSLELMTMQRKRRQRSR